MCVNTYLAQVFITARVNTPQFIALTMDQIRIIIVNITIFTQIKIQEKFGRQEMSISLVS